MGLILATFNLLILVLGVTAYLTGNSLLKALAAGVLVVLWPTLLLLGIWSSTEALGRRGWWAWWLTAGCGISLVGISLTKFAMSVSSPIWQIGFLITFGFVWLAGIAILVIADDPRD